MPYEDEENSDNHLEDDDNRDIDDNDQELDFDKDVETTCDEYHREDDDD